jgi:hypothetical protein
MTASDVDGESVDEGTGVTLLTGVEDGCEPPAVPEGFPESSM